MNEEVVKRFIKDMSEALDELKKAINTDEKSFMSNRTLRFSVRYAIIQLVEAAADLSITILERKFGERVGSYREIFKKLSIHGVIPPRISESMSKLASLRNMIVYSWDVDDYRIYVEAKRGIKTVEEFIREVYDYALKDC